MEDKLMSEAFNISPASVYGVLVAFMGIVIFVMSLVIRHLYNKLISITESTVNALSSLSDAINNLTKNIDDYEDPENRRIRNKEFLMELRDLIDDRLSDFIDKIKS